MGFSERELFYNAYKRYRYDPNTGELWERKTDKRKTEKAVLGYESVPISRIAWLMRYGIFWKGKRRIYHLNGKKSDNRMDNLSLGKYKNVKPGDSYPELTWSPEALAWTAVFIVDGRTRHIGSPKNYNDAARELFFLEFDYRSKYLPFEPPSPTEVYVMWNGLLEVKA